MTLVAAYGSVSVLSRLKAAGVPVVVVLVSSRPLDIAAQLYLTFTGNTTADFVNVNWFQFAR